MSSLYGMRLYICFKNSFLPVFAFASSLLFIDNVICLFIPLLYHIFSDFVMALCGVA